jgi:Xaa-Pro aminopeptidase
VDADVMERQRAAMAHAGLDAMVAYSPDNVAYGAGYLVPSQKLGIRNRQFAVVATRDGESAMLLSANEEEEALSRSSIERLRPYDEFAEDPMEVLAGALDELGVAGGVVGVELDAFPADRWERLKELLPDATWRHAAAAFEHARMIKTPREVESLRRAAEVAVGAQLAAYADIREGMTEQEVYRVIVDRILELGGDGVVMVQVAAGERSVYSNPTPGSHRLAAGEVVKLDVFVTADGYLSDTGRSIVVGPATQAQHDVWRRMHESLAAIRDAVRPGVSTRELWELFVREFDRRQLEPAIRFLGHGLGLSLHEEPFIAAHTDTTLEEGMVFAIEPIYRNGTQGYHLEDIVLVTADGHENLTGGFGSDLVVC